jgi:Mg-chelatase subunit ChlD
MEEQLKRWRLILGAPADLDQSPPLTLEEQGIDSVLEALYDSDRDRGLGSSSPNVNRWLGDIRKYFPSTVVQLMQKDALQKLKLHQMLLQPELLETLEPDVQLIGTLLSLKKVLPAQTRDTARNLVRKLVKELEKKLRNPLISAVQGSLNRASRTRRPKANAINWPRTVQVNLKHYQPSLKTIIPHQLIGHGRKMPMLKNLLLLVDQSGSMASSMVYSAVIGSIMASLPSVKTRFIVFDTSVVDLTDQLEDATDLLFSTQLGGGTHISKALAYAQQHLQDPRNTILVLVSDLMEGGPEADFFRQVEEIKNKGVNFISLLALNDQGTPAYDHNIAAFLALLDIPAFACTPDVFPELMATAIERKDLRTWLGTKGIVTKN